MRYIAYADGKPVIAFERACEAAEWARCQDSSVETELFVRQVKETRMVRLGRFLVRAA